MLLRSFFGGCLIGAAALSALPSRAGLSAQLMRQRHHELLERAGADPARAPVPRGMPDHVAVQLGERPAGAPALVDEALNSGARLQFVQTLIHRETHPLGLGLRLGAVAYDEPARAKLAGSELSLPLGPGEAYVSYESRHWGPGWFGSLILDGAAPPLAAAGWRIAGDPSATWQADLFAGTLRGHSVPAGPRLIGMRLEWRPSRAWTLALARTMQWGGDGRNENLGTFAHALLGRDNTNDASLGPGNEPGNQLAGVDVRYDLALADSAELGAYVQLIGEDNTGSGVPSRRMQLLGIDAGTVLGALSLRAIVEFADTTAGKAPGVAYRHPLYPAGYTHRGQLLGHQVGGDARLASAGLLLDRGPAFAMLALHRGRAQTASQRFVAGDALAGADVSLMFDAHERLRLGVSAHRWRAGSNTARWAQAWAQYSWP